ncbi:nitroreductase [Variovorax beijingensis]|uniref:Nitroreductase n=2 Tax=Variovorax TaxID=34072 RepID=A0AAE4C0K6_VARPD|nr:MULTISPECIES: nitroreductase [Variovorax]MDP9968607.1 nitroreductase [Variovorax paradoxus]MDR6430263.1 nitroreductase [Variovorax paradoxus]MDR6456238.1 nitroreductase [Variovorax paradoxus]TWD72388.1 nitroreductase [Variovorax beijingensis]
MDNSVRDLGQKAIAQCVSAVMRSRHAVRAFKPQPLDRKLVEDILEDAVTAPSGANIQPWRVYVVTGTVKDDLADALLAASRAGAVPAPAHFPDPLPDVFRARLQDFGARYYESLGIDRTDAAARARQSEQNLSFFGAPVGLLFTIDRRLRPHSWIDLGLFAQNVMIAAKARGIDTCPQVSFAPFHDVIATHLQMEPCEVTAFGMSMGHGDPHAPVNQIVTPREHLRDFARIVGFPEEHSAR